MEREGASRTPDVFTASVGSSKSLKSMPRSHGRNAYRFNPPAFAYVRDPETYLISSFVDDALTAAENVVDLFQQAVKVCESVKTALHNFTSQLQLPRNAPLDSCLHKIRSKRGYRVDVSISNAQPPRLDLPTSSGKAIHPEVISAHKQLNEAVELSYEFNKNEKHANLDKDMFLLTTYKSETTEFLNAVAELKLYKTFISDVRRQTECFISDFLECTP